ncbi:AraC family transcriptional regulator ligand-binding domain-containing protein [Phenylobacterium sp.]|uniref:AraC family transcriptional regulator n=1 Tax=Phenylobacterium sp. TaxID=1871053 RepID=UPI0035B28690
MSDVQTIMTGWMNAALDGLVDQGLDRTALTAGLRGFEGGRAPRSSRVDVSAARLLWRRAARLDPDPLLGFKVGAALPMQASNVISILTAHSATVGQALEMAVRYQTLVSASGGYRLRRDAEGLHLTYVPAPDPVEIARLQVESVLAVTAARRSAFNSGARPSRVVLMAAGAAPARIYEDFLNLPVAFAEHAALVFSPAALAAPIPGADPRLLELNAAYAEGLLRDQRRADALCDEVRAVVRGQGFAPDVAAVAAELGLSTRSLQRRLGEAGASFTALRDEARMTEAMVLLSRSQLALPDLARRLGYSQESAFSRAVKAWWGASPRDLRRDAA